MLVDMDGLHLLAAVGRPTQTHRQVQQLLLLLIMMAVVVGVAMVSPSSSAPSSSYVTVGMSGEVVHATGVQPLKVALTLRVERFGSVRLMVAQRVDVAEVVL